MKRITLTFVLFAVSFFALSQSASVEKSTFGIQTGLLGIWMHNESKLSNEFALRSEIGLDAGFFGGGFNDGNKFLLTPVITIEPRWYYNLDKRISKSRNISGNSGNFISVKTSYHPDWFIISNSDNVRVLDQISIIPTWGIRRNIGKRFNYETGIGIGYYHEFSKKAGFLNDDNGVALNLHLRIGYRF